MSLMRLECKKSRVYAIVYKAETLWSEEDAPLHERDSEIVLKIWSVKINQFQDWVRFPDSPILFFLSRCLRERDW